MTKDGFLGNSNQLYDQADMESVQWEAFLKVLDTVFYSEPFTVAQAWDRMNDKTWNDSTRQSALTDRAGALRISLPDFIAQAMDREGFFKRRLSFAFRERLGRRYGHSQVRVERDTQDLHGRVALESGAEWLKARSLSPPICGESPRGLYPGKKWTAGKRGK